jgi:transcriptional regulator with XRE-family HTH domain
MKLEDFRIRVVRLSRPQLSQRSGVSIATIQRAERGETVSKLTAAKLLAAFSEQLQREVKPEEIEDLQVE